MTDHPASRTPEDGIAIDVVIVHGTPGPDLVHALHVTAYTLVARSANQTTYARIHPLE
jgi:hypothetical protein